MLIDETATLSGELLKKATDSFKEELLTGESKRIIANDKNLKMIAEINKPVTKDLIFTEPITGFKHGFSSEDLNKSVIGRGAKFKMVFKKLYFKLWIKYYEKRIRNNG